MKKHEFHRELRRQGLTFESFAELIGRSRETVCRYGADGEDVPKYIILIMNLIQERSRAANVRDEEKRTRKAAWSQWKVGNMSGAG